MIYFYFYLIVFKLTLTKIIVGWVEMLTIISFFIKKFVFYLEKDKREEFDLYGRMYI